MKKILIVDDSPMILRGIKTMLDKEYETVIAISGVQAMVKIKQEEPDLILMDYDMPDMDGKETFERIKANESMKDIPVIFLTGVDIREHIISVLKLNPAGYLLKPVDRDRLMSTIEEALKK